MTHGKRTLLAGFAIILTGVLGNPTSATPKVAAVPPTLEIAVLDPGVDPMGRPAITTTPGLPGNLQIDMPQTVLVHRYYYSGDRRFQAQLLPGGPCIIVVNHPRTAERLYIPVQMTPGAPRVIYTSHAIEYDYGKHGIIIRFCALSHRPKVEYRNGMTIARCVENCTTKVNTACKEFADRSGLSEAKQKAGSAAKNVVKDTADVIGAAGKGIAAPITAIGQMIPGIKMLKTTDEDRAIRLRDAQVQNAEKAAAKQGLTIPTNR